MNFPHRCVCQVLPGVSQTTWQLPKSRKTKLLLDHEDLTCFVHRTIPAAATGAQFTVRLKLKIEKHLGTV